ncbi:hypothetical protein [Amycolatopsis samaneae]|uniref:Uncharacterized protein n=1 Tax=Amycolatopsis samaneae TaxID=664691 RepID=A0ABW5GGP4_9PSEU
MDFARQEINVWENAAIVTAFDADVEQHCGGQDRPAFRAQIRFRA